MDTEKKENKEVNKLSLLIVAVIVLVLIIAGAGWRMNIMNCLFNMKVISLA